MFIHLRNDNLVELECVTTESGRYYITPEGNRCDSVTTVIGYSKRKQIAEWRRRVGEEKANQISSRASSRGTSMHSMVEDYLNNKFLEEQYKDKVLPLMMFKVLKPVLNNINNIHCLEGSLYSDILKIAGRVDCIAEYNGELAVIDFKSSTTEKERDWIDHYFAQACAYAMMYFERTGIKPKKLVILIACEDGSVQVFEEYDLKKYMKVLYQYIKAYEQQR